MLRVCPPSTTNVAPVIKEARSEQRNVTASATSSGVQNRFNGTSFSNIISTIDLFSLILFSQVPPSK